MYIRVYAYSCIYVCTCVWERMGSSCIVIFKCDVHVCICVFMYVYICVCILWTHTQTKHFAYYFAYSYTCILHNMHVIMYTPKIVFCNHVVYLYTAWYACNNVCTVKIQKSSKFESFKTFEPHVLVIFFWNKNKFFIRVWRFQKLFKHFTHWTLRHRRDPIMWLRHHRDHAVTTSSSWSCDYVIIVIMWLTTAHGPHGYAGIIALEWSCPAAASHPVPFNQWTGRGRRNSPGTKGEGRRGAFQTWTSWVLY
jgi:hypothetical protein